MNKNSQGFTLIELLLVVALMAISVGITGDILISLIRSYNKSNVLNEIEQNANFVSQKLIKELRNADRIDEIDSTPGLMLNEVATQITFTNNSGEIIIYVVDTAPPDDGVMKMSVDGTESPLTVNEPPSGVSITCITGNECFKLLSISPQVVQIGISIKQAGNPSNLVFTGDITIEDTVVVRETY